MRALTTYHELSTMLSCWSTITDTVMMSLPWPHAQTLCDLLFDPKLPRDPDSLTWLYPLLDADGNTIMSLDQDIPEVDANGVTEDHFLCMTIALGPIVGTTREVNYRPYNKRHLFTFGYPALTMWNSYTALSIKHSSLVGMLPYAFIASSLPSHAALYL